MTNRTKTKAFMPPRPDGSVELQRPLLRLAGPNSETQKAFALKIEHLPTGHSVSFAAFLDSFSDAYNSEWAAEQVYGRMDPIATFQSTRRALSVSWMIPAESDIDAALNLSKVNNLLSFLYPLYEGGPGTNINMGPLVRVKFANLIQDSDTGEGLLGYVNGFTMDPEMDAGFVTYEDGLDKTSPAEIYPKAIRLNFELTVLHEHALGWVKQGSDYVFRGGKQGFPYALSPGFRQNTAVLPVPVATPPLPKKKDGSTSTTTVQIKPEPNSAAAAKQTQTTVLKNRKQRVQSAESMEQELRSSGVGDAQIARLKVLGAL